MCLSHSIRESLHPPVGAHRGVLAAWQAVVGKAGCSGTLLCLGQSSLFKPYQRQLRSLPAAPRSTASSRSPQDPQPSPDVCHRCQQLASRPPSPPCLQPAGYDRDGELGEDGWEQSRGHVPHWAETGVWSRGQQGQLEQGLYKKYGKNNRKNQGKKGRDGIAIDLGFCWFFFNCWWVEIFVCVEERVADF